MTDAAVLKEFLVELGWKNDETQQRRFNDAITSVTKGVTVMATAVAAAEVALVGIAQRVARSFEALSYASSRVNASARNIASFRYAISQLGGTAEGAMASLEAFSRKLRESPGQEAMLKGWGVRTRDAQGRLRDSTELMKEFLHSRKFLAMPEFTRLQLAESMGIDERTYRAMLGDVEKFTAEYQAKLRKAGLDPDAAAENAKKFQQAWRSMLSSIEVIVDRIATTHFEKIAKLIDKFVGFVDKYGPRIASFFESIIGFVLRAADAIGDLVAGFAELVSKADPIVKKLTGIEGAFEAIVLVLMARLIPGVSTLTALLTGLVGGAAWRSFVGVLAALGMGGGALAAGGAALGFGLGMMPGSANEGEDEYARREILKRDPDYFKRQNRERQERGSLWDRGKRWWGEHAPSWLGGGGSAAMPKSKNLSANQDEAYAAAIKDGLSPKAARALVANMTGEALHKPGDHHWDVHHMSQGVVQWDPQRAEAIRRQFGKYPKDMSVAEQTRAAIWEIRNHKRFAATKEALEGDDPEQMVRALVSNYENPRNHGAAIAQRRAYYRALARLGERRANPAGFVGSANAAPVSAGPIGGGDSFVHSVQHGHTLHAKTTINVNAAGDPGATARAVAGMQKRVHADTIRNMQGAAH
jgi:hypothetical protein